MWWPDSALKCPRRARTAESAGIMGAIIALFNGTCAPSATQVQSGRRALSRGDFVPQFEVPHEAMQVIGVHAEVLRSVGETLAGGLECLENQPLLRFVHSMVKAAGLGGIGRRRALEKRLRQIFGENPIAAP